MPGRPPRVYRTEAIVLRQRRLGEADRIVTLFTPGLGKIDAVAKGVRKQTSRKAGHLEPLTWSTLLLATGQNLDIVTQSETVESFLPLREDLQRLARGLYVAELIERSTGERAENFPVFRLLAETLKRLATIEAVDLAVRYFELRLLGDLGYRPELGRCVACTGKLTPVTNGFSPALGGVVCPSCWGSSPGLLRLSVTCLKLLRLLQSGSFEEAARLRIGPELAGELESLLRGYLRYVLERSPRSLEFVDAVRHVPVPEVRGRIGDAVI